MGLNNTRAAPGLLENTNRSEECLEFTGNIKDTCSFKSEQSAFIGCSAVVFIYIQKDYDL